VVPGDEVGRRRRERAENRWSCWRPFLELLEDLAAFFGVEQVLGAERGDGPALTRTGQVEFLGFVPVRQDQ